MVSYQRRYLGAFPASSSLSPHCFSSKAAFPGRDPAPHQLPRILLPFGETWVQVVMNPRVCGAVPGLSTALAPAEPVPAPIKDALVLQAQDSPVPMV